MKKKRINYFKYFSLFFTIILLMLIAGCTGASPTAPIINSFFMVTFDSQGGSAEDSQIVNHGEKVTEPTDPTKEGYIFFGWYKESGCTNAWDFDIDTVTSDVTLYAGWTILVYPLFSCTVTYNGNGNTAGIVPVDPSSPYEYGATVIVLGNTGNLIRINVGGTSYRFNGWNTKADGSGEYQWEGWTFTMGVSNVTLYAQWAPYVLRDIGPAGGYIFYDKGGYSDGWRYLEAAHESTQWTDIQWGIWGYLMSGSEGTGTGIGAGQSNTTTIVKLLNSHLETGRAAQLCNDLIVDGYNDWFLPSKGELYLMYTNLKVYGVGGFDPLFVSVDCWSSSALDDYYAWSQRFTDGSQDCSHRYLSKWVRAVRAF